MSRIVESLYRVSGADLVESAKLEEGGGGDLKYIVDLLASKYDVKYSTRKFMNMSATMDSRRFSFMIEGRKATLVETPVWDTDHLSGREYRLVINRRSTPAVFWPIEGGAKFPESEFFGCVDKLLASL